MQRAFLLVRAWHLYPARRQAAVVSKSHFCMPLATSGSGGRWKMTAASFSILTGFPAPLLYPKPLNFQFIFCTDFQKKYMHFIQSAPKQWRKCLLFCRYFLVLDCSINVARLLSLTTFPIFCPCFSARLDLKSKRASLPGFQIDAVSAWSGRLQGPHFRWGPQCTARLGFQIRPLSHLRNICSKSGGIVLRSSLLVRSTPPLKTPIFYFAMA